MPDDFQNWLRSRKPIDIPVDTKKLKSVKEGESEWGITKIPPLNADVRFSKAKLKSVNPKLLSNMTANVNLPESFKNYDPTSKELKLKISSTPMNQGGCGSCFAVSLAQCISDAFVYSGLSFNPDLSGLSLLTCVKNTYINAGCEGGLPADLARYISTDAGKRSGILSNACMNYNDAWNNCSKNKKCVNSSLSQMTNIMIPKNCGCCGNKFKHYKYNINSVVLAAKRNSSDEATINLIKQHIMDYGSAVTGFGVYANFSQGIFKETNDVYIKNAIYKGKGPGQLEGGHAVCIVGWGVEPSLNFNGKIIKNVPFWWTRNSWGNNWGISMSGVGGYFKYAMADTARGINTDVAFEQINRSGFGGIILLKPGDIVLDSRVRGDCTDKNENAPNKIRSSNEDSEGESGNSSSYWSYIVISILIIALVVIIYKMK